MQLFMIAHDVTSVVCILHRGGVFSIDMCVIVLFLSQVICHSYSTQELACYFQHWPP